MKPLFPSSPGLRPHPGHRAVIGLGKRTSFAILAGCIAVFVTPQLSADTVTGGRNSINSNNYVTTRSNTLVVSSNSSFTMAGVISGAGSLTKIGPGTVILGGTSANTYSKQTIVNEGILALGKTPGVNAIIGDGISSHSIPDVVITGGELRLNADNQMDDSVYVQLQSGTFNLNGHSETIYNFVNMGGTFRTGAHGYLTLIDPTWNVGSTNIIELGSTVNAGTDPTAPNGILVIKGGTNIIHGAETFGPGAQSTLIIGPGGLELNGNGNLLTINADHDYPGVPGQGGELILNGNVTVSGANDTVPGTAYTASITNGPAYLSNGTSVDGDQTNLINGTVNLGGAPQRTFNVVNAGSTLSIAPSLTNGGILKTGAGTMTLTGNNIFSGATTVSGGTLVAAGTGGAKALGSTSGITVNSGGTLLLNTANQINTSATMTLNGGTVNLAGNSQGSAGTAGLGSLILQATSTLDFGTLGGGANSIQFGGFGGRTPGALLNITDFDFNSDHLYFSGTDASVFTSAFGVNDISFNGTAGFGAISYGSYYEIAPLSIVPVPEPTTILGASGLLGFLGYRERRRIRRLWHRRVVPGFAQVAYLAVRAAMLLIRPFRSHTDAR